MLTLEMTPTQALSLALLGLLVFALLVIVLYSWLYQLPKAGSFAVIKQVPQDTTLGSSSNGLVNLPTNCQAYLDAVTCEVSPSNVWNPNSPPHGACQCQVPFWGLQGDREAYSNKYTAVGNPIDPVYNVLSTKVVDRLSFPFKEGDVICTGLCDDDVMCSGVIWDGPTFPGMGIDKPSATCTLLTGQVSAEAMPYSISNDATLYLKSLDSLVWLDRAFIFKGSHDLRYWLQPDSTIQLTSYVNTVYTLSFFPSARINTSVTGVYSTEDMTVDEIRRIIQAGGDADHYVDHPDTAFALPPSWYGKQIWVGYIRY